MLVPVAHSASLFSIHQTRRSFSAFLCTSINTPLPISTCGTRTQAPRMTRRFLSLYKCWSSYVVESGLQVRATNSPWTGSNVWGRSQSLAPAGWRKNCRSRHGWLPFRKGNSLASRRWCRWETSHPRALRFPAKKTPRVRRRPNDRAPRQHEAARMEPSKKQEVAQKRADKKTQISASSIPAKLFPKLRPGCLQPAA